MSQQCHAFTNKGDRCNNNSAHGYLTCNIKSHITQYNTHTHNKSNIQMGGAWGQVINPISSFNKSNIKIGGGWGQVINPISSFNKYNKKNIQMGGGWGDDKVSFFGLFKNN